MKLNKQLAQAIVKRTMQIIPNSVNVMDENGVIIASGDPSRLGQHHSGAVLALRKNQLIEIDEKLLRQWNLKEAHQEIKQGINIPITYLGENIGVIGVSGFPSQVRHYAELVKMAAELMVEQSAQLEKERWQSRYKEEFILSLAKGELSIEQIKHKASFFQLPINQSYVACLIKLNDTTAEELEALLSHFAHYYPHILTAVVNLQNILFLQPLDSQFATSKKQLWQHYIPSKLQQHNYKISVGICVSTLIEIPFSYHTAQQTLKYAEQHHLKKQVLLFEDYKFPTLLADFAQTWQAKELLAPVSQLIKKDEKHFLFKTMQQYFFSNCDLAHASKKLFIHPNTLRYRLDKIEQITSLSFNKIDERVILYLGALLLK
ncbi:sugar diacid recognition domain-containing protein [Mannheimia sp. AT1]|uniref:Sugar diacid recognition domain-containing protein n=1 Tax=Mannheimia cairinae TaxID=3025936 RepID=A0ABT5MTL3_9PAST|nr:sugar diacid recognition domain-containing protein [Mannheimia cairinae]MDD0824242.1 sugar diacid recognition domain-containing protein [Mannheimia cairinae]MDD0826635.1 sugar diacid recognition domain-containing protein [Mannheimia cairinae]